MSHLGLVSDEIFSLDLISVSDRCISGLISVSEQCLGLGPGGLVLGLGQLERY